MSADPVTPNKRVGVLRLLFPFIVVAIGASIWIAATFWPNTNVNTSNLNLIKMGTAAIVFGLLLIWALRMPSWKKRYVWLSVAALIGLFFAFLKYEQMSGDFLANFVWRDWVKDTFFGGSADTVLERHRESQGKADGGADLTIQPGDSPAFRGANRDGIVVGPKLTRDWRAHPPKEIWRQPVGGGWASFSIANGFLVTIEQRRDREVVVCYQAATGKEVWTSGWDTRFSENLGGDGPRSTPTIAHGDVFAYGAKGRLVCLDGKNGTEKWGVETLEGNANIAWAMSGSPLVVDDLVIVNPGAQTEAAKGRAVRAYDRKTGQEVWAAGTRRAGYSSPQLATLGGKKQVLIFDGEGIAGHDLEKGTELWRLSWPTYEGINVAQPIVVSDSTVFISSDYSGVATGGCLVRVTEADGKWTATEVWRTKPTVMRCKFMSPVRRIDADGDHIYGLNDGFLECVDLKTGKQVWKDERKPSEGKIGHGQILLCDDLILAVTEESLELVLIEATSKELRELGRIKAINRGKRIWNQPAMVGGRIYIRNNEEMVCYDLTEK
jgi:outer membrane protein assembly factor BamB